MRGRRSAAALTGIIVATFVIVIWHIQEEVRESGQAVHGIIAMKSLVLRVNAGDPVEEAELSDQALGDLAPVVREVLALRKRSLQRLQHIEGSPAAQRFGSALNVANVSDRGRIAEGREAVASFISALEQARSEILADRDALPARLEQQIRDARYGKEVVAGAASTTEDYKTGVGQYIDAYRDLARAVDSVLAFLENANGRYTVRNERVVFARQDDLIHYQDTILNVTQSSSVLGKVIDNNQMHVGDQAQNMPWRFDAPQ